MSGYKLDMEALGELNQILLYTEMKYGDDAAYVLEGQLVAAFELLASMPGLGHRRTDLTAKEQLFYPVDPYMIVYARGYDPLRIIAVLHSKRNLKKLLRSRS